MGNFGAVSAEIKSSGINNFRFADSKLGCFQKIKIRFVINVHNYFIGVICDRKRISGYTNEYVSVLELFEMGLVFL